MNNCFKNIILDIDGTIWNTTAVVAVAWNRAVKEGNVPELKDLVITDKMLQKEFGKPMDVIADNLFGDIDKAIKAALLAKCCVYEHDEIAANNEDLSYEGIRETIIGLAKDHNLYIVSNCQDGYIELVMEKNGLTKYIKDYECFGHTGLQKDENITLLLKRNNIGLDEACYVGDTMGDYTATKKAGIPFVFARYGFGNVENPDYIIDTPSDLSKLAE